MKTSKRILALDVGTKSCGVAATDELGITVQPVANLKCAGRHQTDRLFHDLEVIFRERPPVKVLVGYPLHMNGQEGDMVRYVREFMQGLRRHLQQLKLDHEDCEWILVDERLTSEQAEQFLIGMDVSRQKRKEVIDKMAAVFLLQRYLEEWGEADGYTYDDDDTYEDEDWDDSED